MTNSKISNVTAGFPLESKAAGNLDATGKTEKSQSLFASLMSQSSQQNIVVQTDTLQSQERKPAEAVKQELSATADTTKIKQVSDTSSEIQEKLADSTDDVSKEIKDVIKEELSVTDEQLEDAMEQLGLTALDLLNPSNLTKLAAQLTGSADTSELLMSDGFLSIMQQLGDIAQSLADELGITVPELQTAIEQMTEASEAQFTVPQELMNGQADETADVSETLLAATTEQGTESAVQTVAKQNIVQIQSDGQKAEAAENQTADAQEADTPAENLTALAADAQESETDEMSEDTRENSLFQRNSQSPTEVRYEDVLTQNASRGVNEVQNTAPQTTNAPVPTSTIDVADILNQISEYTKINLTQGTSSIEMHLNPENLGKVYLQVSTTKEGTVSAQLAAQNVVVKEALEAQMADLRQSLNQQGIKVDAIEVTVATHEFEKNLDQNSFSQQQQQEQHTTEGRRSLRMDSLDELEGLMTEEELFAARIMKDNGNTMDVTA